MFGSVKKKKRSHLEVLREGDRDASRRRLRVSEGRQEGEGKKREAKRGGASIHKSSFYFSAPLLFRGARCYLLVALSSSEERAPELSLGSSSGSTERRVALREQEEEAKREREREKK